MPQSLSALTLYLTTTSVIVAGSGLRNTLTSIEQGDDERALETTAAGGCAWTEYITEPDRISCPLASDLVEGVGCSGSYCDNVRLYCCPGKSSASETATTATYDSYWTASTSGFYKDSPVGCDFQAGYVMTGVSCSGHWCDRVAIQCTQSQKRREEPKGCNTWASNVSEEGKGTVTFADLGYVATAVDCDGDYCDVMRFKICQIDDEYTIASDNYKWTPYTGDPTRQKEIISCDRPADLVAGVQCLGSYCDRVRLQCEELSCSYSQSNSYWTESFSEELDPVMLCNDDYFMSGLSCSGGYCDNLTMECTYNEGRKSGTDCSWSNWISEEETGLRTRPLGYIRGIECRGDFCDDKRFFSCPALDDNDDSCVREVVPTSAPASLAPTVSPTISPAPSSAFPTSAPVAFVPCEPTSGKCASTAVELQSMLDRVGDGDIVAICGNTTISATSTNNIEYRGGNGFMLCCAGSNCAVEADDDGRIAGSKSSLKIDTTSASSFVMKGIAFREGSRSDFPDYGGHANINGPNVRISDCSFDGGRAEIRGGNLYLVAGKVVIDNSVFTNGFAVSNGGGAAVVSNKEEASVVGCKFSGNTAENKQGGGLEIYGVSVLLKENTFTFNTARLGGGGVQATSGSGRLFVLNNEFLSNSLTGDFNRGRVQGEGGAAARFYNIEGKPFRLIGNGGSGNFCTGDCSGDCDGVKVEFDYVFFDTRSESICVSPDENVRMPNYR